MIIKTEHLYKTYLQGDLEVPVLKDINLEIDNGEYVAIMGPSGSGKSTLMNIIGCLDQATEGKYWFEDRDLSECTENDLSDLRLEKIGFIFQQFQLLPNQSTLENVALPLTYANVPRRERLDRAREMLTSVGLEDRVDFMPTQLSGGQKQRVAIARAMINHPAILLADEPTGALDSESGRQIMALFRELYEKGTTILMITHDANIAKQAERIVTIYDGMLGVLDQA